MGGAEFREAMMNKWLQVMGVGARQKPDVSRRNNASPSLYVCRLFGHSSVWRGQATSGAMAIEAWIMDDGEGDQRLARRPNPIEHVPLSRLADIGILYWHIDPSDYENNQQLKEIREKRGYDYMDLLDLCPGKVENYEEKLRNFFREHLHADEEIRYCLEGSGYFDVRGEDDRWIRIWIKAGDMIVLPAGIYHRFTLDTSNYIKLMRLFIGKPVWTAHNRPQEEHPARRAYVKTFLEKKKPGPALVAF